MWRFDKPKQRGSWFSTSSSVLSATEAENDGGNIEESLAKSLSINTSLHSMISLLATEESISMDHILESVDEMASVLTDATQQVNNIKNTSSEENKNWKEEKEALQSELAQATEQKKALQDQVNKKGEGIKIDGKPVTEIVRDYQTLQLDFEESQLLIRELDEQVLEKEQIIQSMEQEGAEKVGAVPRSEYEALEIELEDLNNTLEDMEEEIADKSFEIQSSQKRQLEAMREAENYRSQLEELQIKLQEETANTRSKGGASSDHDRQELKRQLSQKDDLIQSLVRESSSRKMSVRDNHKVKSELSEALALIEEQEQEIEDLKEARGDADALAKKQQLEHDLSECERLIADQDQEIAERDDKIDALQKNLATTKKTDADAEKMKRFLAEKEMKIYELEESLQAVTAELEDAEKRIATPSSPRRRSGMSLHFQKEREAHADEWASSLSPSSKSEVSSKVSRRHYETLKGQTEEALDLIDQQADDLQKKENTILQLQEQVFEKRSVDDDAMSRLSDDLGTYSMRHFSRRKET